MINLAELREILEYIDEHHSFRKFKGKKVKYVEPVIDMRVGKIFSIHLRGYEDVWISVVNENRDRNLADLVYEYLESEKESK